MIHSLSVKDPYLHFPIELQYQCFLRFHFKLKTFFSYRLSLASGVFKRNVQSALSSLKHKGDSCTSVLSSWQTICDASITDVTNLGLYSIVTSRSFANYLVYLFQFDQQHVGFSHDRHSAVYLTHNSSGAASQACLSKINHAVKSCLRGIIASATPVVRLGMSQLWLTGRQLSVKALVRVTDWEVSVKLNSLAVIP